MRDNDTEFIINVPSPIVHSDGPLARHVLIKNIIRYKVQLFS